MAKRTIRRTAQSVSASDMNEQYFNFASFGGINDNKNYVDVSQYSFEDANNVYVDQDSQLHTRPPVKEITISVFNDDEYCIGLDKINNVTFYHTAENGTYRWRWKYNDNWYYCNSTENSKIIFISDTYIVFNTDSIYGFRWNFEDGEYDQYTGTDIVYIPTTTVSGSTSDVTMDDKNLFADGEITRYTFEYGDLLSANNLELRGETVTVKIGDNSYNVTLDLGTPVIFVDALTKLSLTSVTTYTSYQDTMLIYDKENAYLYFSVDGETFSIFTLPDGLSDDFNERCICLAKDGTEIVLLDPAYTKTYSSDSSSIYTYSITAYYMYSPSTSSVTGWNSHTIDIFSAYDNVTSMYNNAIGPRYHIVFDSYTSSTNRRRAHMSIYQTIEDFTVIGLCCAEQDDFVIVAHMSVKGVHYSYTSGITSIKSPSDTVDGTVNMAFIARVYVDDSTLTSSVTFGGIDTSHAYSKHEIAHFYSVLADTNNYHIDYVKTETYKIVMMIAPITSYYLYTYYANNYAENYETDCILYHIIDSDDNMLNGYGAYYASTDDAALGYNGSTEDNAIIAYVFRTVFCRAYQFVTELPTSRGANVIESQIYGDDEEPTFVQEPYPTQLNYQNGVITYRAIAYTVDASEYTHIIFALSITPVAVDNYDSSYYTDLYLTADDDIRDVRNSYPIYNSATYALDRNQATSSITTLTTESYPITYAIYNSDGDVLTDKYFYYFTYSATYPLLNNTDTLRPLYAGSTTVNSGTFPWIIYYNVTDGYTYSNAFEGYATVDIIVDGEIYYYVPDLYEDFITTTIAIDNKLYQLVTILDEDDGHPKIYFPTSSEVQFIDKITNFVIFSTTSLGVFLENLVYEYSYSSDNDYYTLTPTKLQLGCKDGADIITSYDGATIYVTNIKGLASLSYEDFVQSDEQVYEYLTENIMSLYDGFRGDNKIKLYQYKDWLWMYRQDDTEIYLYDTRSSTWWKWTLPYAIQKMLYNEEELIFLQSDNRLATFKFDDDSDFSDFVGTEIEWHFRSQKLHLSYPNHYKHISQLNVITAQDGVELRYKLKFTNYHNLYRLSDTDTVCFDIDRLSTLIKRVNFMKTNAFQFEIANDPTDNSPKHFETPDIVIKYRVTEAIR